MNALLPIPMTMLTRSESQEPGRKTVDIFPLVGLLTLLQSLSFITLSFLSKRKKNKSGTGCLLTVMAFT